MPDQCTEAEWKIMEVLWDHAPRTMSEITKTLEPTTGWTRHTVITLLKRMQEKGTVAVDDSGDVKRYTPLLSQEEASTQQTQKFLNRVFSGRASLLINHLVDSGEITLKEMDELMDMMRKNGKK
ncbi:MAG: BlaI/MecI/CopY family transcriptional regulator [Clostridia bacterium]|jgi:BlaI family penicillinase repressor|nr:BlaI/MecI/CopY family transcriptional regulator [Clostridia bacterium]